MLKVLIVGNIPLDINNISGGVQSVTLNLLEGFSNLDINVEVFSLNKEINKSIIIKFSKNITINYSPYGILKSTKIEMLFHGRKLLNTFIDEAKPEIIHFQGNGSDLLLSIGLNKKNIVITPHAILREEYKYQASLKKKMNHLLVILIEKLLLPSFNNIIFISSYAQQYFLAKYQRTNKKNYVMIYNPVSKRFFQQNEQKDFLNKFIFIGSIIPRKGFHLLIEALNKIETVCFHLDVVGDFLDSNYKRRIIASIKENDLTEKITFHGWQSPEKVLNLVQKNDCLILPSFQETLPVSIAEAMAMGKIVIASNVGAIKEMIDDKNNGFLYSAGSIEELQKMIINLNKFDLKIVSNNARKKAAISYEPVLVAKKTKAFYESI